MSSPNRLAEARIRRFERLGGVDLSRLEPEERRILLPAIRVGTIETHHGFRFRCPVCRNEVVNDQEMEPMCTGPSWTDDHPYEVMVRVPE